jgi:hypothetical protein
MFKLTLIPIIILVIVLVIFAPFAYIWALNVLFPNLNIAYTFDTWCAMLVAHSFFHVAVSKK